MTVKRDKTEWIIEVIWKDNRLRIETEKECEYKETQNDDSFAPNFLYLVRYFLIGIWDKTEKKWG